VLAAAGVTDLARYHPDGDEADLMPDFFIAEVPRSSGVPLR